jgi:hypothetical protein
MTLEQEPFGGAQDYTGKQRILSRILRKLGQQALPGALYVEQYFQNLLRRNVSAHTLRSAFTTIQSFLVFLQNCDSAGVGPR